jgi:hypothetical protein
MLVACIVGKLGYLLSDCGRLVNSDFSRAVLADAASPRSWAAPGSPDSHEARDPESRATSEPAASA